jgi:hypothetical protein
MFRTKVVEKIKTYILCSMHISENIDLDEIMWGKKWWSQIVSAEDMSQRKLCCG